MEKIVILITVLLISSCTGDAIITQSSSKNVNPYVIEKIESYDSIKCLYYGSTQKGYFNFMNDITFYDSIGKYKIGDKVKAEFIK